MNIYELAKELKDAGFPQTEGIFYVDGDLWDETAQSDYETPVTPHRSTWVKCPTLSELIAACGDKFELLRSYKDNQLVASNWGAKAMSMNLDVLGDTPEEAVARLWLALNAK